jgi:nucleoid-associated protein YgaU
MFSILYRAMTRPDTLAGLAVAMLLSSCNSSSTTNIDGVPSNLPSIPLYGSARTPSHGMSRADYPFDSNGNYVTSWAAEGGSSAGPSDYQRSQQRDRDEPAPRRTVSTARKVSSSTPKKSSSSSSSGSSTKKISSSGGGTKHTVKSNDSLWSIAKKYGTTVAKLKAANGLKSDNIRDGARLTIPR